jgi:hypothetical protein
MTNAQDHAAMPIDDSLLDAAGAHRREPNENDAQVQERLLARLLTGGAKVIEALTIAQRDTVRQVYGVDASNDPNQIHNALEAATHAAAAAPTADTETKPGFFGRLMSGAKDLIGKAGIVDKAKALAEQAVRDQAAKLSSSPDGKSSLAGKALSAAMDARAGNQSAGTSAGAGAGDDSESGMAAKIRDLLVPVVKEVVNHAVDDYLKAKLDEIQERIDQRIADVDKHMQTIIDSEVKIGVKVIGWSAAVAVAIAAVALTAAWIL